MRPSLYEEVRCDTLAHTAIPTHWKTQDPVNYPIDKPVR